MATVTSVSSGSWGTAGTWDAGVPADDDAVVIAAGHNVLMNVDQSAFTGLRTVTITGGATPGMLYFANGTNGYLKIRTGYDLVGTTDTNRGRLLANSDGSWGTTTALQQSNTAVIDLQSTSKIDALNLDIALYCTQPTNLFVETYKTAYGPRDQATYVTPATNVIDWGTAPPSDGTAVQVKSSGTLPGGLLAAVIYYVRAVSGNTCKLATQNSDALVVDITSTGSGNITMYDGHTDTATKELNVIQDVTGDAPWTTAANHNAVVLVDISPGSYDQQRDTLAVIAATKLTLTTNNVDSAQYPCARIYLASRNVSILGSGTSSSQRIVDYGAGTHGGVFQCAIRQTYQPGTQTNNYNYGLTGGVGNVVSGVIAGCNYGIATGTSNVVSGVIVGCRDGMQSSCVAFTISGTLAGINWAIFSGSRHTVSGTIVGCGEAIRGTIACTMTGTIIGCGKGVANSSNCNISGLIYSCGTGIESDSKSNISSTIVGCNLGLYLCISANVSATIVGCASGIYNSGCQCNGAIFQGNLYDLQSSLVTSFSTTFNSGTPYYQYSQATFPYNGSNPFGTWSYDHGGSDGALSWQCQGGTGASTAYSEGTHGDLQACGWVLPDPDWIHTSTADTTATPTGATVAPNWIDFPIQAVDGQTIKIECAIKPHATTNWETAPRLQLIDKSKIWGAVGEVISEDVHALASADWELLSVTHTATTEQQLAIRIIGTKTATVAGSFQWCWRQQLSYPAEANVVDAISYGNAYEGTYPTAAQIAAAMWDDDTSPDRTVTA